MILRFIKNTKGAPNGIDVVEYDKGKTYIVPRTLVDSFLMSGVAIEVTGEIQLNPLTVISQKPKNEKIKIAVETSKQKFLNKLTNLINFKKRFAKNGSY
jgi:hypothetical protein